MSGDLTKELGEPEAVWRWFLWLNSAPRMPGDLDGVRQRLVDVIGRMPGCQARVDSAGNVVASRAASPGREQVPSVCLQAHMDMVCSANNDTTFDFATQGIHMYTARHGDDGLPEDTLWLHAKGTTLGADNGVGLAAGLAVLENARQLPLGPIECLFTADEETTMGGAENLPAGELRSKLLLNVDSEEERAICVGCAGGFESEWDLPIQRVECAASSALFRIHLKGAVGGHTGIDIHRGRLNAIRGLAELLDAVLVAQGPSSVAILSMQGGQAVNTIPREAVAVVSVPTAGVDAFQTTLKSAFASLKKDFDPIETSLELDVASEEGGSGNPLTEAATRKFLDVALLLPHGDVRRNPFDLTEVETSVSFSRLSLSASAEAAHGLLFARTSNEAQGEILQRRLQALARCAGLTLAPPSNGFPGWKPEMRGLLLDATKRACKEVFAVDPKVYSVHAGLECGFLKGKYPDMECVSIGPDIRGAHSPDERCNVLSVDRFYSVLLKILLSLN